MISCSSSFVGSYPFVRTTVALTACPRCLSGIPVTAHSRTAGCCWKTLSTSNGLTLYPAVFMRSSARPTNQMYPSSSYFAVSPVWYRPSLNAFAVSSSSL